jgi:hypothetical protein
MSWTNPGRSPDCLIRRGGPHRHFRGGSTATVAGCRHATLEFLFTLKQCGHLRFLQIPVEPLWEFPLYRPLMAFSNDDPPRSLRAHDHRLRDPACPGSAYWGIPEELRARRKPSYVLRSDGSFALRFAVRQPAASLYQPPPRSTRSEPSASEHHSQTLPCIS